MHLPSLPRRRAWSPPALLLLGLALVLPVDVAGAQGDDDCGAVVVDETGRLDVAEVEEAAAAIDDAATVRVRFYESVPGGVAGRVEELEGTCRSQSTTGLDDVLLLVVSLAERQVFFVGGEALRPALGDSIDEIRDEVITPRLGQGRFTEAVVDGLGAAGSELADAPPDAAGGDPGAGSGAEGAEPADDGSALVPVAALVGAAVVGGGAVATIRRRRLNDRRRRVDESMAEPLGRAGDLRERGRQLELAAASARHVLAGAALAKLEGLRSAAANAGHAVDGAIILLRQAIPGGADHAGHDELERAEQRVTELLAAVEAHDRAVGAFDRGLRRLQELKVTLPVKKELLDEELDDTRDLVRQREAEGWQTRDLAAILDRLDAHLEAIDLTPLRLDVEELSQRVEHVEAELFATRHALQTLAERKAGLEEWAAQLEQSVRLERERAAAAAAEIERLAAIHAPASLAELVDNPQGALLELDRCEAVRARAMSGPFAAQDWDEAGRQLEAAGLHLVGADALLDEIDMASVDLNDAQVRAGRVLQQARQSLGAVQRFVAAHDADLGPRFDTEPLAVASLLDNLEGELRRSRPNYLRVLRTAEQAGADLDRLMAEAQDEQARIAALRRQAEHEVDRAATAVYRARQALGWQILPSREGRQLSNLEDSLADLPADLEARIDAARAITASAQRLEARIVNRRRRGGVWIVGGGMGSGWGMGGGSGGGSFGGGSFGGGSFGGGSFGGGSFGGGSFGGGIGGGGSW